MISLTFPDGSARNYNPGITGAELAASISKSLAKKAVAISLDGALADLGEPIEADARVRILTRDDPEALELIRHDAAHVMAEAVQELYPGTQVTIGPVIENGFYYDFYRDESFTPEDLAKIEERMREIVAADKPFAKEVWSRGKAQDFFAAKAAMVALLCLFELMEIGVELLFMGPGRAVDALELLAVGVA
ncbi:MAG: TGS domain-containing protein, partial [Rhodomicrobium sp.]